MRVLLGRSGGRHDRRGGTLHAEETLEKAELQLLGAQQRRTTDRDRHDGDGGQAGLGRLFRQGRHRHGRHRRRRAGVRDAAEGKQTDDSRRRKNSNHFLLPEVHYPHTFLV